MAHMGCLNCLMMVDMPALIFTDYVAGMGKYSMFLTSVTAREKPG